MKIISWNVKQNNKKIKKLLKFLSSIDADIICLQELPHEALDYINNYFKDRHISSTLDFDAKLKSKNTYICTISKLKPYKYDDFSYYENSVSTILNNLFYEKVRKVKEQHKALRIFFTIKEKNICVINARLSCAIDPLGRIVQVERLLNYKCKDSTNIVCGDFNVVSSRFFNRVTGWMRGFNKNDYSLNEREAIEKLFYLNDFKNTFKDIGTMFVPSKLFQTDHILVPSSTEYSYKEISKKRFGSDHKMITLKVRI
ncbi:endonuclease/exonuclease/phosphatase family protein [Patescibacteria group bacterium]